MKPRHPRGWLHRVMIGLGCLFSLLVVFVFANLCYMRMDQRRTYRSFEEASRQAITNAYETARTEAQRDVQRGVLVVKSAGLPMQWSAEFARILRSRYQVEERRVAGCVVTPEEEATIRGYNEVSVREIERRFGKGVFDQVAKDAQSAYESNKVSNAQQHDDPNRLGDERQR